jgi:hypothetical protein
MLDIYQMKKLVVFVVIIAAVFYLLKYIGFFGSVAEKLADKIKQADIISYSLEWLVPKGEGSDYLVIHKGSDSEVIEEIKQAMENIVPHSQSGWNHIWLKTLGILRLRAVDGSQERIDVTEACFFAGADRVETAAFYSPELSGIIKKMFFAALNEFDQLVSADDLFESLSQPGALKYIVQPEDKEVLDIKSEIKE